MQRLLPVHALTNARSISLVHTYRRSCANTIGEKQQAAIKQLPNPLFVFSGSQCKTHVNKSLLVTELQPHYVDATELISMSGKEAR